VRDKQGDRLDMIGPTWGGDARRDGQLQVPTTVARGYVIYPDPRGYYAVVAVREHVYGDDDDPTWTQSRRDDTSAGHRLDRVVVEQVAMSPDAALDAAISLWDESSLPVCLYLNGHGKVIFDDFWESVVGHNAGDMLDVLTYLGYDASEKADVLPLDTVVNGVSDTALRMAIGLDHCIPKPDANAHLYAMVPRAAVEVWRDHAASDPSAQGLNYVAKHPIVKSIIRAYFDLYDPVDVTLAFDATSPKHYGWYNRTTGDAHLNYGAFVPEYILTSLGLGHYDVNTLLDAFTGTIIHEMTHHAERVSGFVYEGRWVEQTSASGDDVITPEGSELMAKGAEYAGAYALRAVDADWTRHHMREAFGCTEAFIDIQASSTLQDFNNLMGVIEFGHNGTILQTDGMYIPIEYAPLIKFTVKFAIPEDEEESVMHTLYSSDFDVTCVNRSPFTRKAPAPVYETVWAKLECEVHVPVDDQPWIQRAYLKYPAKQRRKNTVIR